MWLVLCLWHKRGIPAASLLSLSQHGSSQIKAFYLPKNVCKVLKWYSYIVISGTLFLFGAMKPSYVSQVPSQVLSLPHFTYCNSHKVNTTGITFLLLPPWSYSWCCDSILLQNVLTLYFRGNASWHSQAYIENRCEFSSINLLIFSANLLCWSESWNSYISFIITKNVHNFRKENSQYIGKAYGSKPANGLDNWREIHF